MGKLDGKVAIITGGSGGIGKAAARLFVAEGAQIMVVDLGEEALRGVVADIGGDNIACCAADVTDPAANDAYVQATVDRFGGVDIALLNAGIEGDFTPLVDYPELVLKPAVGVPASLP